MHVLVIVYVVLALAAAAAVVHGLDSSFTGWMGEVARSELLPNGHAQQRWMEVLSWPDRAFLIHNLLSPEEADHFIERARGRFVRSGVVDDTKPGGTVSDVRTSSGTFFGRGETPTIAAVEERIAQWVMVDKGQGEGFQVLDYKESQEYRPHFDTFFTSNGLNNGGNRLLTILVYLSDVEEGGETVFPNIAAPPHQTRENFSECAMQGMAVKPRKGDATVFWSLKTTGDLNPGSRHGSCPVIKGEKFSATKWYHVGHFAMPGEHAERVEHKLFVPPPPPAPPGCRDAVEQTCPGWAETGANYYVRQADSWKLRFAKMKAEVFGVDSVTKNGVVLWRLDGACLLEKCRFEWLEAQSNNVQTVRCMYNRDAVVGCGHSCGTLQVKILLKLG